MSRVIVIHDCCFVSCLPIWCLFVCQSCSYHTPQLQRSGRFIDWHQQKCWPTRALQTNHLTKKYPLNFLSTILRTYSGCFYWGSCSHYNGTQECISDERLQIFLNAQLFLGYRLMGGQEQSNAHHIMASTLHWHSQHTSTTTSGGIATLVIASDVSLVIIDRPHWGANPKNH